jgi:FKBP-type peptidyl-prolyl cis-trans isomerase SlpA
MASNCVQPGSFLTLHYRLSGPEGDIINTFPGQPATLTLGTGELAPAVEKRLLGMEEGGHATFEIPAGEAFGERNPEMVQWVTKKMLRDLGETSRDYHPGEAVQFPTPDGMSSYAGHVKQVGHDAFLFDFNHPLAGRAVTFEAKVIGIL